MRTLALLSAHRLPIVALRVAGSAHRLRICGIASSTHSRTVCTLASAHRPRTVALRTLAPSPHYPCSH
ncbi:hypothetical protein B0H17DRAFT_1040591 [Mycena rosella]|uniref:Uncharacterized protein n=1 Tax=Mycena rosella TaxID=1033263 RepID=A0AAD7GSB4_MYCRO|nr:hypothetical protein B0H17DRAFT_1040591 [Mycena rosella]